MKKNDKQYVRKWRAEQKEYIKEYRKRWDKVNAERLKEYRKCIELEINNVRLNIESCCTTLEIDYHVVT